MFRSRSAYLARGGGWGSWVWRTFKSVQQLVHTLLRSGEEEIIIIIIFSPTISMSYVRGLKLFYGGEFYSFENLIPITGQRQKNPFYFLPSNFLLFRGRGSERKRGGICSNYLILSKNTSQGTPKNLLLQYCQILPQYNGF